MYCYLLKLLFLITRSYFLKQAATSIYSEVRAKGTIQVLRHQRGWWVGWPMMMFDDKVGGWGWLNADMSKKYTRKKTFYPFE